MDGMDGQRGTQSTDAGGYALFVQDLAQSIKGTGYTLVRRLLTRAQDLRYFPGRFTLEVAQDVDGGVNM
jgi:hypothetical protein